MLLVADCIHISYFHLLDTDLPSELHNTVSNCNNVTIETDTVIRCITLYLQHIIKISVFGMNGMLADGNESNWISGVNGCCSVYCVFHYRKTIEHLLSIIRSSRSYTSIGINNSNWCSVSLWFIIKRVSSLDPSTVYHLDSNASLYRKGFETTAHQSDE